MMFWKSAARAVFIGAVFTSPQAEARTTEPAGSTSCAGAGMGVSTPTDAKTSIIGGLAAGEGLVKDTSLKEAERGRGRDKGVDVDGAITPGGLESPLGAHDNIDVGNLICK